MSLPTNVDLKGKVAIVTGGASGVGLRIFRQLLKYGAKVYLADVNEERGRVFAAEAGEFLKVDLATIVTARAGADAFLKKETRLDILVNCAALLSKKYALSPDGIVDTMGVNHFGHFAWTMALLPVMKETAAMPGADVRIVTVGSNCHGWLDPSTRFATLEQINAKLGGDSVKGQMYRYCLSKLANTLFVRELQHKLDADGSPIIAMVVHPGAVYSEGARGRLATLPWPLSFIGDFFLWLFCDSPETASLTAVFAAAAPDVTTQPTRYRGAYLMPVKGKAEIKPMWGLGLSDDLAKELWATSERVVEDRLAGRPALSGST